MAGLRGFAPVCVLALGLVASGCAPSVIERGPAVAEPALERAAFTAEDGARFRVRSWLPAEAPWALVIGVHGINDRSLAFEAPAAVWRAEGVAVYAFDQRGFAQSPGRGYWPGTDNLVQDLTLFARLLRARFPETPIFLLGESMGGGVALVTAAGAARAVVDGAVLVAPAAVAWETLPLYWRGPLWVLAHTVPWFPTSGRGLELQPTDNIEVWREMSADPDIIRETRIDALYGLARLTDAAARAAGEVRLPLLVLYGRQDVFVRNWMFADLEARLPKEGVELEIYEEGYHWLLRDLGAEQVYDRILDWMASRAGRPPMAAR